MRVTLLFVMLLLFCRPTYAQPFPNHTITMIVPFAAGGPADVVGRILANHLGKTLPIIVENMGGAGGNLGSSHVARSTPDGYTLLFQNISMAISPALYKKLNYDPVQDFEDIGLVAFQPNVLLSGPKIAAASFQDLEKYLKANQASITFANTGTGGASYLCAILLMNATQLKFTSVPYRGTSQAMTDLLGGQVDLLCDSVATATPLIRSGSVKAFGVTSARRVPQLPDVPTLAEQGLEGFDMVNWTGVYAPKGTPAPTLVTIRSALSEVLADPTFKSDLERVGSSPFPPQAGDEKALARYLDKEMKRWSFLRNVDLPPQ
jgi:tripartite-type tricarboxylate transporter receptor subunit TctC